MQKPVNQRQLSWLCSENILTTELFLELAVQMLSVSDFGPIQNPSITLSGGALPIQLTGEPNQVRSDFDEITDKRFTTATFKAVFPNSNNLNLTLSANLSFGQINASIQNGTDETIDKMFLFLTEKFPRTSGPSDQEIDIEKGLYVYSNDLILDADQELTDIEPDANNLIYQFIGEKTHYSYLELMNILKEHGIKEEKYGQVLDFLLYYGFFGVWSKTDSQYIYNVNYNLNILRSRIRKKVPNVTFEMNPAFWYGLELEVNK